MNDPVSFDLEQDFLDEVHQRNLEARANGTAVKPSEWRKPKASVENVTYWGMLLPALVVAGLVAVIIEGLLR